MDYPLPLGEVVGRLRTLLDEFCADNIVLLKQNPHEDAIVDELKEYLVKFFDDFPYDINHNYDLMHSDNEMIKKTAEFLYDELPISKIPKGTDPDADIVNKEILPDFIFHDLQSRNHNFLMLEIKKTTNKRKADREMDMLKLKVATSGNLDYDYGCFIDITTGKEFNEDQPFYFTVIVNGEVAHQEPAQ